MTNEQINLVKTSFEKIAPASESVANLFYTRLFELDPNLRPLFKDEIEEQGRKLMQIIGMAVKGLERFDHLIPAVEALGMRHISYGIEEHHYETVGAALLWTLENVLGADFTAETKKAWTNVYVLLAQTMKNAGRQKTQNMAVAV